MKCILLTFLYYNHRNWRKILCNKWCFFTECFLFCLYLRLTISPVCIYMWSGYGEDCMPWSSKHLAISETPNFITFYTQQVSSPCTTRLSIVLLLTNTLLIHVLPPPCQWKFYKKTCANDKKTNKNKNSIWISLVLFWLLRRLT